MVNSRNANPVRVLCHEHDGPNGVARLCEGRSFEVGNQGLISSHRKLMLYKATMSAEHLLDARVGLSPRPWRFPSRGDKVLLTSNGLLASHVNVFNIHQKRRICRWLQSLTTWGSQLGSC